MEVVILIIVVSLIWWVISAVLKTGGAALKAAVGEGTFEENFASAFADLSELHMRMREGRVGEDGGGLLTRELECRGTFPLTAAKRVGFVTSVFDMTSGELEPVIGLIEGFQEDDNLVYQTAVEVGTVSPGQGFTTWVRTGLVLPELLEPPRGGKRKLVAILRLVDLDNPPAIKHGFHEADHPGILWAASSEFEYVFTEKGYLEAAENRNEARALALKIGVGVAMADGSLEDAEGNTLKEWILRVIELFDEEEQSSLKELYNNAMREAYSNAKAGLLDIDEITERLNEIGERATKYEAIELCFDVMAADGVAHSKEIALIRKVATALELNFDEIEKLRDQTLLTLQGDVHHASVEELLGIEPHWDNEAIKKHLRAEFQKWNNRFNTLAEGDERNNAQRMLDLIADARRKYG